MTRHDELVEEIAEYLTKSYRKGFAACRDHHKPEEGIVPQRDAKRIIALTLKAVVDGELDEELGLVGRVPWHSKKLQKDDEELWIFWLCRMMAGGANQFIALRPTSHRDPRRGGTGEEEK